MARAFPGRVPTCLRAGVQGPLAAHPSWPCPRGTGASPRPRALLSTPVHPPSRCSSLPRWAWGQGLVTSPLASRSPAASTDIAPLHQHPEPRAPAPAVKPPHSFGCMCSCCRGDHRTVAPSLGHGGTAGGRGGWPRRMAHEGATRPQRSRERSGWWREQQGEAQAALRGAPGIRAWERGSPPGTPAPCSITQAPESLFPHQDQVQCPEHRSVNSRMTGWEGTPRAAPSTCWPLARSPACTGPRRRGCTLTHARPNRGKLLGRFLHSGRAGGVTEAAASPGKTQPSRRDRGSEGGGEPEPAGG